MSAAVDCEILTTGLQGKSWLANLKPEALRGIIKKEFKRKESEFEREREREREKQIPNNTLSAARPSSS